MSWGTHNTAFEVLPTRSTLNKYFAISVLPKDNEAVSSLRSTGQALRLKAGRMSTLPRWGGGRMRPRGYSLRSSSGQGSLHAESISQAGKVGLPCSLCARLLSFRAAGWDPSARARNRGTFMPPPPRAGSRALFSFHPVLLGFNGQKLCPLPHCGDTNVHSAQGLPSRSPAEGRGQGCYKGLIVCWGPRSE